jgi:hypothetical protein
VERGTKGGRRHEREFSFFTASRQFHFEVSTHCGRQEGKQAAGSKPKFRLPAEGADSASGAAERVDAVRSGGEKAEDFCDHGAEILAGLVGQPQGDQKFF